MLRLDGPAISGLDSIKRQLALFPDKVKVNVVRGAMRAGAAVIAKSAKENVPVRTGALKKSIRVSSRSSRGDWVRATAKAGNKEAWYAHLVEFGTGSHWINPKNRKALRLPDGRFVRRVDHPGSAGQPFMRPALDENVRAALNAAAAYMRRRLAIEARKAGMPAPQFTDDDEAI